MWLLVTGLAIGLHKASASGAFVKPASLSIQAQGVSASEMTYRYCVEWGIVLGLSPSSPLIHNVLILCCTVILAICSSTRNKQFGCQLLICLTGSD